MSYDLEEYNGKLASLHMAPMAGAPVSLRNALQAMLARSASLRPPAISFTAAGYFQVCLLLQTRAEQHPRCVEDCAWLWAEACTAVRCMGGARGMQCGLPLACTPNNPQKMCLADHRWQHLHHCKSACACRRTCC